MHFTLIWNMVLYHGMNYRIMGFEDVDGIQGDVLNAQWERWNTNLGIGSSLWFGHSQLGCLCSAPMRCNGVRLRWLNMYVDTLV